MASLIQQFFSQQFPDQYAAATREESKAPVVELRFWRAPILTVSKLESVLKQVGGVKRVVMDAKFSPGTFAALCDYVGTQPSVVDIFADLAVVDGFDVVRSNSQHGTEETLKAISSAFVEMLCLRNLCLSRLSLPSWGTGDFLQWLEQSCPRFPCLTEVYLHQWPLALALRAAVHFVAIAPRLQLIMLPGEAVAHSGDDAQDDDDALVRNAANAFLECLARSVRAPVSTPAAAAAAAPAASTKKPRVLVAGSTVPHVLRSVWGSLVEVSCGAAPYEAPLQPTPDRDGFVSDPAFGRLRAVPAGPLSETDRRALQALATDGDLAAFLDWASAGRTRGSQ